MNLLHYFCIFIVLFGNNSMAQGQERKPYRLSDMLTGCSIRLSKIIEDFCNNMYKIVKRDTSLMIDKLIPEDFHKHIKQERLKRWRRVRRQVATECCDNPCTVSNILEYCPADAVVLKENPGII